MGCCFSSTQQTLDDDNNNNNNIYVQKHEEKRALLQQYNSSSLPTIEGHVTLPIVLYKKDAQWKDHFSAVTRECHAHARKNKYAKVRSEDGFVFQDHVFGSVPLNLYWDYKTKDSLLTANEAAIDAAAEAGYIFVRTVGYVYKEPRPGTVPLKVFYHKKRKDTLSICHPVSIKEATRRDFQFVRDDCYVLTTSLNMASPALRPPPPPKQQQIIK